MIDGIVLSTGMMSATTVDTEHRPDTIGSLTKGRMMALCSNHADVRTAGCRVCDVLETIDAGDFDEFLEEILEVTHRRKRELRDRRRSGRNDRVRGVGARRR